MLGLVLVQIVVVLLVFTVLIHVAGLRILVSRINQALFVIAWDYLCVWGRLVGIVYYNAQCFCWNEHKGL